MLIETSAGFCMHKEKDKNQKYEREAKSNLNIISRGTPCSLTKAVHILRDKSQKRELYQADLHLRKERLGLDKPEANVLDCMWAISIKISSHYLTICPILQSLFTADGKTSIAYQRNQQIIKLMTRGACLLPCTPPTYE